MGASYMYQYQETTLPQRSRKGSVSSTVQTAVASAAARCKKSLVEVTRNERSNNHRFFSQPQAGLIYSDECIPHLQGLHSTVDCLESQHATVDEPLALESHVLTPES